MIDRLVDFAQALWLLAFAFYVLDVARLLAPGQLLLREAGRGKYVPTLASFPFELSRRELFLTGLLVPWRAVLRARWQGAAAPDAIAPARVREVLRRLGLLRITSCVNFVLLFIAAPALTVAFGLGYAVLVVAPVVYALNLAAGCVVVVRRESLALSTGQALWLLADALLCAPYGANWTQRATRHLPELAPRVQDLRDTIAPDDYERLAAVIGVRGQQPGATEP